MTITFRNDIISHVPTCCLIEDYQKLSAALQRGDIEDARVTLDCLAEVIDRYTEVPEDLNIKPSPSSILAMGVKSGIIVNGKDDLKCAVGRPISLAMDGGCCQCDENCQFFLKECFPKDGELKLENGFVYNGSSGQEDALLFSLENPTKCKEENNEVFVVIGGETAGDAHIIAIYQNSDSASRRAEIENRACPGLDAYVEPWEVSSRFELPNNLLKRKTSKPVFALVEVIDHEISVPTMYSSLSEAQSAMAKKVAQVFETDRDIVLDAIHKAPEEKEKCYESREYGFFVTNNSAYGENYGKDYDWKIFEVSIP